MVEETTERTEHLTLALSGKFVFPSGEMPERYQQVEEDVTNEDGGQVAEMLRAVLRLGYMMGADDAFSGQVRVNQGSGEAERGEDRVPYAAFRATYVVSDPSPFGRITVTR
jgi:hypothetical protein